MTELYTPAYLFAFITRIAVFFCSCSLFPRKLVPLSVRLGLVAAFVIFFAPLIPGLEQKSSSEYFYLLQNAASIEGSRGVLKTEGSGSNTMIVFPGYEVLLIEAALGLLLSVSASLAAYTARLTALWLSRMVLGPGSESPADLPDSSVDDSLLETTVLILLLGCLFYGAASPAFCTFIGRALFVFPYRAGFTEYSSLQPAPGIVSVVAGTGSIALTAAMLFALPVFLVSIVVDFLYFPLKRYFAQAFSESLVAGSKGPALILLLALTLYPFTHDLAVLLEESLGFQRARLVVDQFKGQMFVPDQQSLQE